MKSTKAEGKGSLTIASVNGDVEEKVSTEKEKFAALIEAYKVSNPDKYEIKKEALEAKLKSL
jgi:hypothetical protein